jgi:hypothetical protein
VRRECDKGRFPLCTEELDDSLLKDLETGTTKGRDFNHKRAYI